jgi:hypothetical protein
MADLTKFVISGYDETFCRVTCELCPKGDRAYGGRFTLAHLLRWADEHWSFLHETQEKERNRADGTDRTAGHRTETPGEVWLPADPDDAV